MRKLYRVSFVVGSRRHYWFRFGESMENTFELAKTKALEEYPNAHGFMVESHQDNEQIIKEWLRP